MRCTFVRAGKCDNEMLSKMIEWAEQDTAREHAIMLGSAMADEDGVVPAVGEIETLSAGRVDTKRGE